MSLKSFLVSPGKPTIKSEDIAISGIFLSILGLYFGGLYGLVFASLINSIFKFLFFTLICISEYKKIDIY